MNIYRFHINLSAIVLTLAVSFVMSSLTAATKIEFTNKISPLQIGATVLDNGGRKGSPSINIWPPDTGGSGQRVNPGSSWMYDRTIASGSSTTFEIQINANRLSGQCDRLCGHVKVNISPDGETCTISQGRGRCRGNGGAPKWTVSGRRNVLINRGICYVSLNQINIISKTICSCQNERYPCITTVTCLPGTCPVKIPRNW